MIAFIDETQADLRQGDARYVLIAAAVVKGEADRTRDDLRRLLLPRQRRLHWNEERAARRDRIVEAISRMEFTSYAAVEPYARPTLEQRARASCFHALLPALVDAGVVEVVVERRDEHLDRADRQTIAAMIRYGQMPREFRYRFSRPGDEPLLWLADALAGVTRESLLGSRSYLDQLGGKGPTILPG